MAKERMLDVEKVNNALKRAARTAMTGTREERSGRFTAIDTTTKPATTVAGKIKKKK